MADEAFEYVLLTICLITDVDQLSNDVQSYVDRVLQCAIVRLRVTYEVYTILVIDASAILNCKSAMAINV
jgi:hypothetical protein